MNYSDFISNVKSFRGSHEDSGIVDEGGAKRKLSHVDDIGDEDDCHKKIKDEPAKQVSCMSQGDEIEVESTVRNKRKSRIPSKNIVTSSKADATESCRGSYWRSGRKRKSSDDDMKTRVNADFNFRHLPNKQDTEIRGDYNFSIKENLDLFKTPTKKAVEILQDFVQSDHKRDEENTFDLCCHPIEILRKINREIFPYYSRKQVLRVLTPLNSSRPWTFVAGLIAIVRDSEGTQKSDAMEKLYFVLRTLSDDFLKSLDEKQNSEPLIFQMIFSDTPELMAEDYLSELLDSFINALTTGNGELAVVLVKLVSMLAESVRASESESTLLDYPFPPSQSISAALAKRFSPLSLDNLKLAVHCLAHIAWLKFQTVNLMVNYLPRGKNASKNLLLQELVSRFVTSKKNACDGFKTDDNFSLESDLKTSPILSKLKTKEDVERYAFLFSCALEGYVEQTQIKKFAQMRKTEQRQRAFEKLFARKASASELESINEDIAFAPFVSAVTESLTQHLSARFPYLEENSEILLLREVVTDLVSCASS